MGVVGSKGKWVKNFLLNYFTPSLQMLRISKYCHKQVLQTGASTDIQQLKVLEAGSPRPQCRQRQFPPGPLSLLVHGRLLPCLHALPPLCVFVS